MVSFHPKSNTKQLAEAGNAVSQNVFANDNKFL